MRTYKAILKGSAVGKSTLYEFEWSPDDKLYIYCSLAGKTLVDADDWDIVNVDIVQIHG